MKVDNRINYAMVMATSKEEVIILDRNIYLMDRVERKEKREEITKKIDKLILQNNKCLTSLNSAVKDNLLDNSVYEMFEDYIEDVNTDLMKIADRL